jgi:crotonobetainyl-CoA:carnitine CoA-transferase CaiB-like acyl-CoA transferase
LRENGVPHSLIYSPVEIVKDPHFAARGTIATLEHPRLGPLKMPAAVPRLSSTPAPPLRAAPLLGENTDEVLRDLLGLSAEQLASLRADAVV